MKHAVTPVLWSLVLVVALGACGRRRGPAVVKAPVATVKAGACANPLVDGVLSAKPALSRADRDLNDDGQAEAVVADRHLCSSEGNCQWNVFWADPSAGCQRYLGTIAGASIQRLGTRDQDGFHALRALWKFAGGGRILAQEYRFRRGVYEVVDAVVCQHRGDRLLCAAEPR